eukprot:549488-Amorphochlora_amoeboformis.AAC.1
MEPNKTGKIEDVKLYKSFMQDAPPLEIAERLLELYTCSVTRCDRQGQDDIETAAEWLSLSSCLVSWFKSII